MNIEAQSIRVNQQSLSVLGTVIESEPETTGDWGTQIRVEEENGRKSTPFEGGFNTMFPLKQGARIRATVSYAREQRRYTLNNIEILNLQNDAPLSRAHLFDRPAHAGRSRPSLRTL